MNVRMLTQVINSVDTSDGAGVRLRRSLGGPGRPRLDPFLMLDEFGSDTPNDYLAGFPSHPHRGFTTVTYMLEGRMRHQDHLGNQGDLAPGDVQWMTAGRGIVHSEMPQQTEGRMRGFQMWLNLPSKEKMQPAAYRDIPAALVPVVERADGVRIKVIAGSVTGTDGAAVSGPINGSERRLSTDPRYWDIELPAHASFSHALDVELNALVYVYEGSVSVGPKEQAAAVPRHAAGILSPGDLLRLHAGADGARVLLLAAKPIGEPVVQYGPFVMNTREEIEQAISDYQSGAFTRAA